MVYFKQKGIYYIGRRAYQSKQGSHMVTTANKSWQNHEQEDNILDYFK